jgi:hypothetical protein
MRLLAEFSMGAARTSVAHIYEYSFKLRLANVSFLQGRRVIYTITSHSYNSSHSLATFHNNKFLLG